MATTTITKSYPYIGVATVSGSVGSLGTSGHGNKTATFECDYPPLAVVGYTHACTNAALLNPYNRSYVVDTANKQITINVSYYWNHDSVSSGTITVTLYYLYAAEVI